METDWQRYRIKLTRDIKLKSIDNSYVTIRLRKAKNLNKDFNISIIYPENCKLKYYGFNIRIGQRYTYRISKFRYISFDFSERFTEDMCFGIKYRL